MTDAEWKQIRADLSTVDQQRRNSLSDLTTMLDPLAMVVSESDPLDLLGGATALELLRRVRRRVDDAIALLERSLQAIDQDRQRTKEQEETT